MKQPYRNNTAIVPTHRLGWADRLQRCREYIKKVNSSWIILQLVEEKPEHILDLTPRFIRTLGYPDGDMLPTIDILIRTILLTAKGYLSIDRNKYSRKRVYRITNRGAEALKAHYADKTVYFNE